MNIANKRVLVTGGCGFIGSHLCERLLADGADVVVLDNLSSGRLSNLEGMRDDIDLYKGDIVDESIVSDAIDGCDVVLHQAYPYGKAGRGIDEQFFDEGVIGTTNLLEAAVKHDVEKFVYASTVAVYGIQEYVPLDESHPIRPFLPYGATKEAGEQYCRTFANIYGLDTVSLRYFYVYGPRYAAFDHSALVKFLNLAVTGETLPVYGDGEQVRDYTYIDDVVEGTMLAATTEGTDGEIYNISSGSGLTIYELAETIQRAANRSVDVEITDVPEPTHDGDTYCQIPRGMTEKVDGRWIDTRDYVADISKAQAELGYEPRTDFADGVQQTMAWMETTVTE